MKQCPECGEMIGNEATTCFKCLNDVSDIHPIKGVKGKIEILPDINIWIILVCIIQPFLAIIIGCVGLAAKDLRAKDYIKLGFKIIGIEIIVGIVGVIIMFAVLIHM